MREILFRGKCFNTEEWVEGYLGIEVPDELVIQQFSYDEYFKSNCIDQYSVKPETIGQYTGLTDKNGTKIFEGDICWFYGGDYYSGLWEQWEQNAIVAITDMTDDEQTHYLNNAEYCEVIGNIHDNPELLKGDAENE